jgi:hypothetical protein
MALLASQCAPDSAGRTANYNGDGCWFDDRCACWGRHICTCHVSLSAVGLRAASRRREDGAHPNGSRHDTKAVQRDTRRVALTRMILEHYAALIGDAVRATFRKAFRKR